MLNPLSPNPRERWFHYASPDQKRAAVHVLLAVATGDGKFHPSEKTYIADACTKMGLSTFDVAEALVKGMPEEVDAPSTRAGRLELLLDAAAVMVADLRVDDRELAVLLMVGQSLGFTSAEVSKVASRVIQAMEGQEQRAEVLRRLVGDGPLASPGSGA
ncbi:MAG: TerB family tellurite resistance protein [Phycisphaerae bacterium]|nr:TerB family tellurite resistance protein [Phycisphaerae bacterium]